MFLTHNGKIAQWKHRPGRKRDYRARTLNDCLAHLSGPAQRVPIFAPNGQLTVQPSTSVIRRFIGVIHLTRRGWFMPANVFNRNVRQVPISPPRMRSW